MQKTIGIILIILGIVGLIAAVLYGLYFWGVVCIVGSIVDVINQIKAPEVEATVVAWAFLKFIGATIWGILVGLVCCVPWALCLAFGVNLVD